MGYVLQEKVKVSGFSQQLWNFYTGHKGKHCECNSSVSETPWNFSASTQNVCAIHKSFPCWTFQFAVYYYIICNCQCVLQTSDMQYNKIVREWPIVVTILTLHSSTNSYTNTVDGTVYVTLNMCYWWLHMNKATFQQNNHTNLGVYLHKTYM